MKIRIFTYAHMHLKSWTPCMLACVGGNLRGSKPPQLQRLLTFHISLSYHPNQVHLILDYHGIPCNTTGPPHHSFPFPTSLPARCHGRPLVGAGHGTGWHIVRHGHISHPPPGPEIVAEHAWPYVGEFAGKRPHLRGRGYCCARTT